MKFVHSGIFLDCTDLQFHKLLHFDIARPSRTDRVSIPQAMPPGLTLPPRQSLRALPYVFTPIPQPVQCRTNSRLSIFDHGYDSVSSIHHDTWLTYLGISSSTRPARSAPRPPSTAPRPCSSRGPPSTPVSRSPVTPAWMPTTSSCTPSTPRAP